jgi:mannose-6-phosphate isomerase-like protein (cupin superfamily)
MDLQRNLNMVVEQKKINKPWGHEIIWSHCEKFVGKILCINEGHKLSRQYHVHKEETIFVLTGTLLLELGMGGTLQSIELKKGQSFHVTQYIGSALHMVM